MVQTFNDPQIVEVETLEGYVLYIRYNNSVLTCQEKWSGNYLASGSPFLPKQDNVKILSFEQIEFYLEMYSNFQLNFI